jgi:nucleotide-binding universal stress UspA family protein
VSGVSDVPRVIPHRSEALAYLASVIDRHSPLLGAPPVIALEEPDPAVAIAKAVADGAYDVVAMATHGRSGLSRMLMGSVAEQVLALATTPVLLYRPRLARLPAVDLSAAFRIYGD